MPADTSSISLLAKRQRVKINSDYLCKHMEDAEYGPRRSISPLISKNTTSFMLHKETQGKYKTVA